MILLCLTNKCVTSKFKKSSSYEDYLDEGISERLRIILRREAALNFSFDKKFNAAETRAKKFFIGEELKEERNKLLSEFSDDVHLTFAYRIHNMNVNYISGRVMRKIRLKASEFIDSLIVGDNFTSDDSVVEFKKKLIKRAARLYLLRMKQIRYKILNSGDASLINEETLIPKS